MKTPKILEKYREYLESTLRPTNEIVFTPKETKPWESKLGGCPYLKDISAYPEGKNGRPMMFLAQLNLEEMKPLPNFPEKGILQFFVEDEEPYGLDAPCFVKYIPEYIEDETKLVRENPYEASYQEYKPFSRNGKMSFQNKEMPVGTECGEFQNQFFDKVTKEEWDALYEFCDASGSRVGGYPVFVQCAPEYYDDGSRDVLLLQLDVDNACGIMFGDSGNCTFLISETDLKNRDFSKVEYDWQCC